VPAAESIASRPVRKGHNSITCFGSYIYISHLLTSNLFLLSSISRNIGYSFLKRLGSSKIYN